MNCIAVDIGNTSTSIALVTGRRVSRVLFAPSRSFTKRVMRKAIRRVTAGIRIDGSILCSVVPALGKEWLKELSSSQRAKPIKVSYRLKLGVKLDYPSPSSIGEDRLANAAGVFFKYGAPAIVADFGTAVTFDVISKRGAYVGGVIAPGIPLMTDYLAEKTALLPRISPKGSFPRVGKSTEGAMRFGAKVGYRGMVREIVKSMVSGLKMKRPVLCATGGYAPWVMKGFDMDFIVDSNLTLYGLGRIFELNCGGKRRKNAR